MAGVIGGNAGYATVDPLQNHMGQAMSANDDLAMKYRTLNDEAMRRKAAERLAKDKLAADQEEKDKLELDKTKNDMTPYSTINGPLSEAIMQLKKQYAEASHQYRNNFGLSESEKLKHMDTMNNSLSTLGRLSQNSKLLNDNLKNFKDHAGDYDQDSYDEFMHRLSSLENGQYKLDLSNGNQNVTIANPDGKGEPVTMSFEDFVNGKKVYRKSEADKTLQDRIKSWEATPYASDNGAIRLKGTKWTDRDTKEAQSFAGSLVATEHDRYKLAKNYNLPVDDVEGIKSRVFAEIKNGVKLEKEVTEHADKALNYRMSQDKKKEDEAKPVATTLSGADFMDDYHEIDGGKMVIKDGKKVFVGGKRVSKKRSKEGIYENGMSFPKGLAYKNAGGKEGMNNLSINSAFINKKGQIIYTADVLDSKGVSTKTAGDYDGEYSTTTEAGKYGKTSVVASPAAEAVIARAMGLSSTKALRAELLKMNNAEGTKPVKPAEKSSLQDLQNKYKF